MATTIDFGAQIFGNPFISKPFQFYTNENETTSDLMYVDVDMNSCHEMDEVMYTAPTQIFDVFFVRTVDIDRMMTD
jgi:hypothetical protein